VILYNIRIALKSLKRSPILSAVIVSAVMLGITVSTIFATIRHSFAKDPIPTKSSTLYYVRIDSWDPLRPYIPEQPTVPPNQVTYRDMTALMNSPIPVRKSGMFKSNLWVSLPADQPGAPAAAPAAGVPTTAPAPAAPADAASPPPAPAGPLAPAPQPRAYKVRPERTETRLCFADFFTMFDVPFKYGSGWDRKADADAAQVVVLSEEENEKLFGGQNSVGRTVRIMDRDFKVVGVIDHWRPSVRFYDLTQSYILPPEKVFLPLSLMPPMRISTAGNTDGWRSSPAPGFEGFLTSETCWLQLWVELPTEAKRREYEDFMTAYVMEQKKAGRLQRPLNNRLSSVLDWMAEQNVVPDETNAMAVVSLLFLAVCSLNLMGLLLGKFLARAPEVGVRRALGARRRDIFLQHIVECEIVGVIGGVLGLLISVGGLKFLNKWMQVLLNRSDLFRIDLPMALLAIGLSLLAGLIAGVYPAWRICRIQPAVHLKVQ